MNSNTYILYIRWLICNVDNKIVKFVSQLLFLLTFVCVCLFVYIFVSPFLTHSTSICITQNNITTEYTWGGWQILHVFSWVSSTFQAYWIYSYYMYIVKTLVSLYRPLLFYFINWLQKTSMYEPVWNQFHKTIQNLLFWHMFYFNK